ncbi:glycosyltransferase family 2 protein, partial [Chamaesiphon polymorphus]
MDWLKDLAIEGILGAVGLGLLLFQGTATAILLSRLIKGAVRRPPLMPKISTADAKLEPLDRESHGVSVVVPTLNEVDRIAPCLTGLSQQGGEVREILIVDSNSQDGTRERVTAAAKLDSRFKLLTDDPLPAG